MSDLFERRYAAMVRLAELLLGDRASGEDVAQEAFARVWRRLGRINDPTDADGYLRTAVINQARTVWRRRRLALQHRQPATDPIEDGASARAEQQRLLDAVHRLPARQRECLILRYYLGLTEAEIAVTLGISTGTVKTHASRGLDRLAELLGGDS